MARLEEVERRLLNWARWKHGAGSGGLGYSGGSTWNMVAPSASRYREAVIPTVDCEAGLTDVAVRSLDDRLRATIHQVYLTGDSATIDARKLGCTESAVRLRVSNAHRRIANWFTDRRQLAEIERARVEALQRAGKA